VRFLVALLSSLRRMWLAMMTVAKTGNPCKCSKNELQLQLSAIFDCSFRNKLSSDAQIFFETFKEQGKEVETG
jgi:hypothetical protein